MWTSPILLIGYKFVLVLGLIHFQQRFSEITYCTFIIMPHDLN